MNRQYFLFRLAVIGFLFLTSLAWGRDIRTLSEGAPKYLGHQLPESSYVEFTVRKLAHARVVWVNFDLLREMGVDIPKEGLTPEFEQKILDAFAWAIPNDRDPADAFTHEERKMYADRYGGNGLGVNWGSGRAGSMGEVQIKGIGITPLVGTGQTFDHAHGGASLEESMREAVWGEVNDQELPWGANRVLAIIDTGTATKWTDGGQEPRALIVREDPLRPAHFVAAQWGRGDWSKTEDARVEAAVKQLPDDLPADASAKTVEQKLESGMKNYVDRMADQYAAAFARSLYHGATSVSNFEISGRYIDYGTQTAQPGFAPITVLNHVGAFGDMKEIKSILIDEFRDGAAQGRSFFANLKSLPGKSKLNREFDERYVQSLNREFLILLGAPPELAKKLESSAAASQMKAIVQELIGTHRAVNVDKEMPANMDEYDLRDILTRVADDRSPSAESLGKALQSQIPDQKLRSRFINAYLGCYSELKSAAASDGVSPKALASYIQDASKIRNRKQMELIRSDMRSRNVLLIDDYKNTGNRTPIWNEINSHIAAGERSYSDVGPYELVLKDSPNLVEGWDLRHIYDAKSDQDFMVYHINLENGKGLFHGNEISEWDLKAASIHYSLNGWASAQDAPAIDHGSSVEFRIPMGSPYSGSGRSVDLVLRSADGTVWWKKDEKDVHLNVSPDDHANPCVTNLLGSWWY